MKYRKKPVVIEAVYYDGQNLNTIESFAPIQRQVTDDGLSYGIDTLEGFMKITEGDWIIKGVNGEFYPCKPDIFEKTYERVEVIVQAERDARLPSKVDFAAKLDDLWHRAVKLSSTSARCRWAAEDLYDWLRDNMTAAPSEPAKTPYARVPSEEDLAPTFTEALRR